MELKNLQPEELEFYSDGYLRDPGTREVYGYIPSSWANRYIATPKLLAALKQLLSVFEECVDSTDVFGEAATAEFDARCAVALAEGSAQPQRQGPPADITAEEADRLYDEAPADPISDEEVDRLVEVATGGCPIHIVPRDVNSLLVSAINELRQDAGSYVNILCENQGDGPRNVIVCNGAWTKWQDQRFSGETLDQAIAEALGTYRPIMEGM